MKKRARLFIPLLVVLLLVGGSVLWFHRERPLLDSQLTNLSVRNNSTPETGNSKTEISLSSEAGQALQSALSQIQGHRSWYDRVPYLSDGVLWELSGAVESVPFHIVLRNDAPSFWYHDASRGVYDITNPDVLLTALNNLFPEV